MINCWPVNRFILTLNLFVDLILKAFYLALQVDRLIYLCIPPVRFLASPDAWYGLGYGGFIRDNLVLVDYGFFLGSLEIQDFGLFLV